MQTWSWLAVADQRGFQETSNVEAGTKQYMMKGPSVLKLGFVGSPSPRLEFYVDVT